MERPIEPDAENDPAALAVYLQQLHAEAGLPSSRKIAADIGGSRTHVNRIITGKIRTPSWDYVDALVTYLGGDPDEAKKMWLTSRPTVKSTARRTQPQIDLTNELLSTISAQLAEIIDLIRGHDESTPQLSLGHDELGEPHDDSSASPASDPS